MSLGIDAKAKVDVQMNITLTLTIEEAKALNAIAGYGTKPFLDLFYEKMGKHYLQPQEKDFILFLEKCQYQIPKEISKIERAKKGIIDALAILREP